MSENAARPANGLQRIADYLRRMDRAVLAMAVRMLGLY